MNCSPNPEGQENGQMIQDETENQPLDRQVQKRTDKRLQSQTAWSAEVWKHESVQERRYIVYCSALNLPRTSLGFISLLIVCFKITNAFVIVRLSPVRSRRHGIVFFFFKKEHICNQRRGTRFQLQIHMTRSRSETLTALANANCPG